MKKSLYQKITQKVRSVAPLTIRHKLGPIIAYIMYVYRIHLSRNRYCPHILSIPATIDLILKEKLSVIRFGDGEIYMIDGGDTAFQKSHGDLVSRLESIIQTNDPGLLICVPGIWDNLEKFEPVAYWFLMHHIYRNGHVYKNLLSLTQTYGDTNITRSYLPYRDKSNSENLFKKLFSMWEGQCVVLIEGEKSRLGVGNDMFKNTKSMQRLLCPPENAYSKYNEIKNEAIKLDKNTLILISLGPTAKVLAYDLFKEGYRVIDIGHIDMEYEMFLRRETKQVKVRYKYFNEIHERNPEECSDPEYLSQIITTIK